MYCPPQTAGVVILLAFNAIKKCCILLYILCQIMFIKKKPRIIIEQDAFFGPVSIFITSTKNTNNTNNQLVICKPFVSHQMHLSTA